MVQEKEIRWFRKQSPKTTEKITSYDELLVQLMINQFHGSALK